MIHSGLFRIFSVMICIVITNATVKTLAQETNVHEAPLYEPELTYSDREHWAFQPIKTFVPPQIKSQQRCDSLIDQWILARLESAGLEPTREADRATWLRRVCWVLTGLPPSVEDLERYLQDVRVDANRRIIDRYLADPAFGQRMAQHWLDLARFAETDGFEHDKVRPEAWRYRDWVIDAMNADQPYDDFIRDQIAGDEADSHDPSTLYATGYLLCGPDMPDINLQEERRHTLLNGMTANVGEVILGLQFGCAQCHDHKTDPLSQFDFYRLRAYFDPIDVFRSAPGTDDETAATAKSEKTFRVVALSKRVPESHLWIRGDFRRPGPKVEPRFPRILRQDANESQSTSTEQPHADKLRTQLAQWLFSRKHPLTSRVIVNRVWQWSFGKGLVSTPNDFGMLGAEPTHPELLDTLAIKLQTDDWSLKSLMRRMVSSHTFALDSRGAARELLQQDPENELWGRSSRRRLDGESLRDAMLALGGTLQQEFQGPGVRPPLPKEVVTTLLKNQWPVTESRAQHDRRSIYLFARRNLRFPLFEVFDKPDSNLSCPLRSQTTIAPQALQLMNSTFAWDIATRVSSRIRSASSSYPQSVELLYKLTFQRPPKEVECSEIEQFLAENPEQGWIELCLALMNSNEFIYVD